MAAISVKSVDVERRLHNESARSVTGATPRAGARNTPVLPPGSDFAIGNELRLGDLLERAELLGDEECQFERLHVIQSRIAERLVAHGKIRFVDLL
jgi:hypothetical protein